MHEEWHPLNVYNNSTGGTMKQSSIKFTVNDGQHAKSDLPRGGQSDAASTTTTTQKTKRQRAEFEDSHTDNDLHTGNLMTHF